MFRMVSSSSVKVAILRCHCTCCSTAPCQSVFTCLLRLQWRRLSLCHFILQSCQPLSGNMESRVHSDMPLPVLLVRRGLASSPSAYTFHACSLTRCICCSVIRLLFVLLLQIFFCFLPCQPSCRLYFFFLFDHILTVVYRVAALDLPQSPFTQSRPSPCLSIPRVC